MMSSKLLAFVDTLIESKKVTDEDIIFLQKVVLPEGIQKRSEADALIALDRAIQFHEQWTNTLIALVVNYVLWGDRRNGNIDRETAHWLISSLEVGELSETAARITQDVVIGADVVDPVLIDFVLQRVRRFSRNRYNGQDAA